MDGTGVRIGTKAVLPLEGDLDLLVADELRRRLEEELDRGVRDLVLDLSRVDFCDSSGLGVLLGRYRRLRQTGGTLRLTGVSPRLYRVLELSGLTRILPVERREEMAHG